MRRPGFILAVITFLAGTAFAQAPVPVAERVVTQNETATRVTLFSDRAVVVTIRTNEEQEFMRRITLPDDQYMVYLAAFRSNAEELDEKPIKSKIETATASVALVLHVGPEAPRMIRFSPMATVTLPLARIMSALDDLQSQVFEASPSFEEVRNWTPKRGDRVQLMNGSFARVVEVWPDGMLVLEHEGTFIREMVSPEARDQVVLHILDSDP
jgi:hypothetical protein